METKKKRANWVPVVTGILRKGEHILVGLRPEGKNLAGQWEFPGGKMEVGESPESALKRELQEELSIEAEIGEIRLVIYPLCGCRHFCRIEPEKLRTLEIPDANRKLLDQIISFLS